MNFIFIKVGLYFTFYRFKFIYYNLSTTIKKSTLIFNIVGGVLMLQRILFSSRCSASETSLFQERLSRCERPTNGKIFVVSL